METDNAEYHDNMEEEEIEVSAALFVHFDILAYMNFKCAGR